MNVMSSPLDRRDFLKAAALVGSGLLISFPAMQGAFGKAARSHSSFVPNAFLHIGEDDTIRIILSKVEMGQGVWTTLPMLIAEELDCDLTKVVVEHCSIEAAYNHTTLGIQATVGSSSTYSEFDRYRYAGATARAMLVAAAAKEFGVNPDTLRTQNGFVIDGPRKLSYGKLASVASGLPRPSVTLRHPHDWKIIGRSQARLDGAAKVNGTATYGIDIMFQGLYTAVVSHPPVFGGTVISFDASAAKAIKGVRDVVKIPTGVAVIADHYWAAKLGRDALKIDWDLPDGTDTAKMIDEYRALSHTKGMTVQLRGDVEAAFTKSTKAFEAEYFLPYLAHASMEPLNCTVKLVADQCHIWTGTQLPTTDRNNVATILNINPENVKIVTPFLGGSFGRRGSFNSDWIVEAVHIARQSGKAIKMIWTRADDMRAGYYRPAYLHNVKIATTEDGLPAVWQHRIVGQPVFGTLPPEIDGSSIEGVKDSPYIERVPDVNIELHTTTNEVPVLPMRSVGFSQTIFVMESVIDELAQLAKIDPVEYRRKLLKNQPRYLDVLNLAAKKSGWNAPLIRGRFRGIAVSHSHRSYVAHVVELSIEKERVRVHRVVSAIDCGLAVNPDGVRAQVEGAVVFGLSAALFGEITLVNGTVKQGNFDEYKMVRMNQMPIIEVHIVPRNDQMGGAGEPGVPAVAPALTNALFAATGKRFRRLPIGKI